MKNDLTAHSTHNGLQYKAPLELETVLPQRLISKYGNGNELGVLPPSGNARPPGILFLTSYPPRECGIATYSYDLVHALKNKFGNSFSVPICALDPGHEKHSYPTDVNYVLDTSDPESYASLAHAINLNPNISAVMVQHEFGFFNKCEKAFQLFLKSLAKPVSVAFHTVLPRPDESLKQKVREISDACSSVVVMTNNSAALLEHDYHVSKKKITVIPHGTHLVPHLDKEILKQKYGVNGKKVLSTFGLLSSGKNIETTLEALPAIAQRNPDVVFLIIGKTHPSVIKQEGERYRNLLEAKIEKLGLQKHVQFINTYLPLPELLEYLQFTDIYLFTSKDPNQAVSGTFSYAISCGCPIISTPIPHAKEILREDAGVFIDFGNSQQLSKTVNRLLSDEGLRKNISLNGLHRITSTSWENAAVAHALLFEKICNDTVALQYTPPPINLGHIKKMTTDFGMIQFSVINQPDPDSGYTLDDNARALIALCRHYDLKRDSDGLPLIQTYFNFINHCLRPEGYFLNYVDDKKSFTEQNNTTNLADANGRAVWALGHLISLRSILPAELTENAEAILKRVLAHLGSIHSTRAMAFIIKGLFYWNREKPSEETVRAMQALANRLVQMYRHESDNEWKWFESYLTYGNGILPEAMLCTYLATGEAVYKDIAKESFDFLLENTFNGDGIKVISNKGWLHKGAKAAHYGEQPIDVSYTIFALSKFYDEFRDQKYLQKMYTAFDWFLGRNHLHQIIYNPCTGGCYDGLEEHHVNLNQGAESTVSYLLARLTIEKYRNPFKKEKASSGYYAPAAPEIQTA